MNFKLIFLAFLTGLYAMPLNLKEAESKVTVEFVVEEPTEPVKPRDPNDPSKIFLSSNQGTGNVGVLTLDYIPNFSFNLVNAENQSLKLRTDVREVFVQLTDVRGSAQGWAIQAGLGPIQNKYDASIHGRITLTNGKAITNSEVDQGRPFVNPSIVLQAKDSLEFVDVVRARPGTGMGTWLGTWLDSSDDIDDYISLDLDAKNLNAKSYGATMTWVLIQTP